MSAEQKDSIVRTREKERHLVIASPDDAIKRRPLTHAENNIGLDEFNDQLIIIKPTRIKLQV